MALCGDSGCSIAAGSGVVISGSGTPGDPWLISVTDPADIAEIENDIAAIQAVLTTAASTYVNAVGDTMTGSLNMRATAGDQVRLYKPTAADSASVVYYDETGTLRGWCGVGPSNEVSLAASTHALVFSAYSAERGRFDINGSLLIGKASDAIATAGIGLNRWGAISASTDISAWNITHNKTGGADVVGQIYEGFMGSGTTVGSVSRATSSTVSYNTSSDEDLKENVVEIDDELALLWMRTIEPVFFNFKVEPDVRHVGYIAQRMAEAWPESVTTGIVLPGKGSIEDRTWDDDGNETTPPEMWSPWQIDYSKFTPILHAALQANDRRLVAQQATITAQARQIVKLEARLDALEAAATP